MKKNIEVWVIVCCIVLAVISFVVMGFVLSSNSSNLENQETKAFRTISIERGGRGVDVVEDPETHILYIGNKVLGRWILTPYYSSNGKLLKNVSGSAVEVG